MPVPFEVLYLLLCLVLVLAVWFQRFGGKSRRNKRRPWDREDEG